MRARKILSDLSLGMAMRRKKRSTSLRLAVERRSRCCHHLENLFPMTETHDSFCRSGSPAQLALICSMAAESHATKWGQMSHSAAVRVADAGP